MPLKTIKLSQHLNSKGNVSFYFMVITAALHTMMSKTTDDVIDNLSFFFQSPSISHQGNDVIWIKGLNLQNDPLIAFDGAKLWCGLFPFILRVVKQSI